ncbi:MAG: PKD domain-containing protein [Candidatus Thermoplasmatota archaeon]|nr:PKD domain-containing protein [Candidatus Thermoplasmatota archaeon]
MKIKSILIVMLAIILLSSLLLPQTISTGTIFLSKISFLSAASQPLTQFQAVNDISVDEAWALLSNTSNGIQLPIDVRTDGEWLSQRIDTPFPEFPRHFSSEKISTDYQEFLDLYDGNDIIVYCKSGARSKNAAIAISFGGFNGIVYNMLGGIDAWRNQGFPVKNGNTKPNNPTTPDGPSVFIVNTSIEFFTKAVDPDDDPVRYGWDFTDDGIIDQWTEYALSSTLISIEHRFSMTGTYQISVVAQDNVGSTSDPSEKLTIQVNENTPPSIPSITGPSQGTAGTSYEYAIVSTDPDGDDISYYIDWGDGNSTGWTRLRPSDDPLLASHSWDEKNTFTVQAKAKDIHEAESDWATLEVTMPRAYNYPILMRLVNQHPFLQRILSAFF